eukprot:GHVH01001600.1.p1 GENE.GHVH01001600.1~~GHVH01001600.1.p1  ORF type:complete len:392 (-),score=45.34 GHVH01001600.1:43-1218(-)
MKLSSFINIVLSQATDDVDQPNIDIDSYYETNNLMSLSDPTDCTCQDNGGYTRVDGYKLKDDSATADAVTRLGRSAIFGAEVDQIVFDYTVNNVYNNFDKSKDVAGAVGTTAGSPFSFYPKGSIDNSKAFQVGSLNYTIDGPITYFFSIDGTKNDGTFSTARKDFWSEREAPNHYYCRSLCESVESKEITASDGTVSLTPPCTGYQWTNDYYESPYDGITADLSYLNYSYDLKYGNGHPPTSAPESTTILVRGTTNKSNLLKIHGLSAECELFFATNSESAAFNSWIESFLEHSESKANPVGKQCVQEGWVKYTTFVKDCSCKHTDYVYPDDDEGMSIGKIVGIVIGVLILAVLVAVAIFYLFKWLSNSRQQGFSPISDVQDREVDWEYDQ